MNFKNLFSITFAILGLLISAGSSAQMLPSPYADRWSKGRIMLTSDDTLKGTVNYNPATDLLQINIDNTIKTFSAQQVASFDFFDTDNNIVRYYKVYPFSAYSNYQTPVFFETLQEGAITLLVRENAVVENAPMYDNFGRRSFYSSPRIRMVYDFYFKKADGKVQKYKPSKKALLDMLSDKQSEIKAYIKEHRLSYSSKKDLIQIINYYNTLKAS